MTAPIGATVGTNDDNVTLAYGASYSLIETR